MIVASGGKFSVIDRGCAWAGIGSLEIKLGFAPGRALGPEPVHG
jgi:hypothetical protein